MPFSFTFAPSSRPAIGKLLLKSLRSLDQVRVGQRKMSVEGKVGAKETESDPFSKKHVRSTKRTSPRMGRLNRSTLSALENKIQVYIPIALLYNRRKSLRELMKEKENKIEIFKR